MHRSAPVHSTAFFIISLVAIAFLAGSLFMALFEPALKYRVVETSAGEPRSEEFRRVLEALLDAHLYDGNRIEVLPNGEVFYEAELESIASARHNVHLEAYIFEKGGIGRRFVETLAERARAGVQVKVVLDAIGCARTGKSYFRTLIDAGGQVEWYHPLRWYDWTRINNRTHRELLVVDGTVGYLGGAGIADHWWRGEPRQPRWRDTMFRVTGPAVSGLQSTFSENWLESAGEILFGPAYFPRQAEAGTSAALVIESAPSAGASTRARILFQALLAGSRRRVCITTPYFLPDHSARHELMKAVRERGVQVQVLAPGRHADHGLTRSSGRRGYGHLLQAGVEIYEYRPSMIHAKILVVDDTWCVVGSTNFDHRSFGINDEVNLAAYDPALAARLVEQFEADLAESERITYRHWKARSPVERAVEMAGWMISRQE